jgi:four helix bundle protein
MSRDHRKLRVFHVAHSLTIETYRQTRDFPREEWFGLRSQMTRAAVSVATNIVEGSARFSRRDYLRFLQIAFASGKELQYLIALAQELEFSTTADWAMLHEHSDQVVRQLNQLIDRIGALDAEADPARRAEAGGRWPVAGGL